jgi:hypothetical protein
MTSRFKHFVLLALAVALLFGASQVQNSMNRDRDRLGLTHAEALENAPPVLAFTTVALGGFRGLISNLLWIRASDLQEEDKYFEMMQLADWITKLEPHFPQVWVFQAWNMAYNISVKFKDFPDRWRWLNNGIELLRDEGLKYNPNDVLIYRELAWFFQHKMGANLDDANVYYKQQWANQMAEVFGKMKEANFDELINPQTDDQKKRAALLRDKFKMDPAFMKKVDERYGPLEWRLPEAHAIYWAALGLDEAARNPGKVNADDLIQLRRVIFQSMLLSFQRGRLEVNPFEKAFDFGPNLAIIPNVQRTYMEMYDEEPQPNQKEGILHADRNFLRQAIYSLYINDWITGHGTNNATAWYKYLAAKYPNQTIIDNDPTSFPRNVTLDQYAVSCIQTDISETSRDRVKTAVEGLLRNAYLNLVLDNDDRYEGFRRLAEKVRDVYQEKIKGREAAIGLPTIQETSKEILNKMLDPENGLPPEAQAILRTKLNLAPQNATTTNAAPVTAITNAVLEVR